MHGQPRFVHFRQAGLRDLSVDWRLASRTQAYTSRSSGGASATIARLRDERNLSASIGGARAIAVVVDIGRDEEDERSREGEVEVSSISVEVA